MQKITSGFFDNLTHDINRGNPGVRAVGLYCLIILSSLMLASCATKPLPAPPFVYDAGDEPWIEVQEREAPEPADAGGGATTDQSPPKRVVKYKSVVKKPEVETPSAKVVEASVGAENTADDQASIDALPDIQVMTDGEKEQGEVVVVTAAAPTETTDEVVSDTDEDGVPDSSDQCADSVKKLAIDETGCVAFEGIIEGIEFETGASTLKTSSSEVLDRVAQAMNQQTEMRVSVLTHVDSAQEEALEMQLSKRRTLSVIRYLIGQGISGSRVRPDTDLAAVTKNKNGDTSRSGVEFRTLSN